jgi:hypothetical protein
VKGSDEVLPGAKSDGFGLVAVKSEPVAAEPGVKCGEAELKSGEVRLEGVSCCNKKKLSVVSILL